MKYALGRLGFGRQKSLELHLSVPFVNQFTGPFVMDANPLQERGVRPGAFHFSREQLRCDFIEPLLLVPEIPDL